LNPLNAGPDSLPFSVPSVCNEEQAESDK
jgi:hypothetical protein